MTQVKRIYVEKKPEYAVAAKDLLDDIHSYLNIQSVTGVRVLIRYDIENITDKTYESAKAIVFSEPPVDVEAAGDNPSNDDVIKFSEQLMINKIADKSYDGLYDKGNRNIDHISGEKVSQRRTEAGG